MRYAALFLELCMYYGGVCCRVAGKESGASLNRQTRRSIIAAVLFAC